MDDQTIIDRSDARYNQIVEASTKPGDFEATKRLIEAFCAAEDLTHSGVWHRAAGMREVRELDPEGQRHPIWLQDCIMAVQCADVVRDVEAALGPDDLALVDTYLGLSGCEVFTLPSGDFIYLDNPTVHQIVEDDAGMRLHCEDGPAIAFADGSCLYAIDDIVCPDWVVTTPAEALDPKAVLGIVDVDVRMIALRKMGLHRALDGAREVDSCGGYTLYDLAHLFDGNEAIYLDMVNPTTGEHHLEGVDNKCATVAEALRFRAGGRDWAPCQIDNTIMADGNVDQYQQGDILIARCDELPDEPILASRELLSSANQRRHVAKGITSLRGGEERAWVEAKRAWKIVHPEHGEIDIPAGAWEVWGVVEIDHLTGILRTVVD